MAAGKILDTGNALYGNIIRALSRDTILPTMRGLDGGADLPQQGSHDVYSKEVPAGVSPSQGIATDGAYWYEMNNGSIYKRDFTTGAEVASNLTPFTGMPAAVNHCGDGFVKDGLLYVPCVDSDPALQEPTDQRIGVYNTSDLSIHNIFDTTHTPLYGGSGLCLAPNGNLYGVSFYNLSSPNPTNELRQRTIWEFDITDGSLVATHLISRPILGAQGIVFDGTFYLIPSWAITSSNVVVLDASFNYLTELNLIGSGDTTEIEGIEYFGGKYYTHDINVNLREFELSVLYMHPFNSTPVNIIGGGDIPETGAMMIKLFAPNFADFYQIFDSEEVQTGWNSWVYGNGDLAFRLNPSDTLRVPLGADDAEFIVYYSWDRSGSTAAIELGVSGVVRDSANTAWVSIPSNGFWLGGKHVNHSASNYIYNDVLMFDKVLTPAELLDAYNNFGGFYVAEGTTPQGVTTIDSATPTATAASVGYSYDAADATGFKYSLDGAPAVDVTTDNPFVVAGLAADTEYSIELTPYNANGDGAPSAPFVFQTQAAPALPVQQSQNQLLTAIVLAVGGTVTQPVTRNSLLQNWLDAL